MAFKLRCPVCREKFFWNPKEKHPAECPICHVHIGHDRADDDVVSPSLRSLRTVANDAVYRYMEKSSEVRAEQAAEMAGVPVSEMSGLKITNMKDNLRPGDIAAMPVNNPVTQQMEMLNARGGQFGFGGGANGIGFSQSTSTGPEPNAGLRTMIGVRQDHASHEGWDKIGDRPANEMYQPGYRPRV